MPTSRPAARRAAAARSVARGGAARRPRRRRASQRRAEHAQRGVALELVDRAAVLGRRPSTTTRRTSFSSSTTSCGGRVAASSVEPTRSTNSTATSRISPPSVNAALERLARHVLPDLAAEQVAQPLALAQARDHLVEAGLEQADLAAVVDGQFGVESPSSHAVHRATHRRDAARRPSAPRSRLRTSRRARPIPARKATAAASSVGPDGSKSPAAGEREDAEQRDAGPEGPRQIRPHRHAGTHDRRRGPRQQRAPRSAAGAARPSGSRPRRWSRHRATSRRPPPGRSSRTAR